MFPFHKLNSRNKMKGQSDFRIRSSNLILPEQPYHDDFLQLMDKIFYYSSIFGVAHKSLRSKIWSAFLLILLMVIEGAAIWKVIKALAGWASDITGQRSVTARLSGTIFYAISALSLVLTSKLSLDWKNLASYWTSIERSLAINIPPDKQLKKKMLRINYLFSAFCLLEHVMSMISLIGFDCPPSLILKKYILQSHGFIILQGEYSVWIGILLLLMSTVATILWSFQDVVIVLISMGLTSRYHRLNKYLVKICDAEKKGKWNNTNESLKLYTWRKLREAYVKQAQMVRKMDGAMDSMIVMSCSCNFYFICLQLFMGISVGRSVSMIHRVYFVISLLWLSLRIGSTVLYASDINVYSKSALKQIFAVEANCYNVEMERLQNQLAKDDVALSGMGFFSLNRNILLKMAGAILTYELVLIQYDNGSDESLTVHLNVTNA